MRTQKLILVEQLPEHLKKMILQDLESDGKRIPSHVMLKMEADTVHSYQPIYMIEVGDDMILQSPDPRTRRRRKNQ